MHIIGQGRYGLRSLKTTMKFTAVLAFAAVALVGAQLEEKDQEGICGALKTEDSCYAEADCSWCKSGAVPSACHSTANAAHLPGAVFQCEEKALLDFDEIIKEANSTSLTLGSCGNCGITYEACCIAGKVKDAACECHLQPNGNGSSAKNCGTCGVAYRACCLGTSAAGREKCNCDIK